MSNQKQGKGHKAAQQSQQPPAYGWTGALYLSGELSGGPVVGPISCEISADQAHHTRGGLSCGVGVSVHFHSPDGLRVCLYDAGQIGNGKAQRVPGLLDILGVHQRNLTITARAPT